MKRHDIVFTEMAPGKLLKRAIWVTDMHLDAADPKAHQAFFDLVIAHEPSFLLVGGDISNGSKSLEILRRLEELIKKPIYYVFGNHDYYYGSIYEIRQLAKRKAVPGVVYLTQEKVLELTPSTGLIGHDGWSDGRSGDFLASDVLLNDYFLIDELKNLTPQERLEKLTALGGEAAENIKPRLIEALDKYDHVIFLTHPPPFREACWYDGEVTNDNWAPHFVCRAMGEVLLPIMQKRADKQLLVLSGHSHQATDTNILPNLRVLVGDSTLGEPIVQGIIHVG